MVTKTDGRGRLRGLLHLHDNPHRIALAFSLGALIAFSPFIGLHTVSAVFLAWVFRLNVPAVLLGTLLNNPWTSAPIFGAGLRTGLAMHGRPHPLEPIHWEDLTMIDGSPLLEPDLKPFLLGTTLLGIAAGAFAYPCAYYVIKEYRRLRRRAGEADHV